MSRQKLNSQLESLNPGWKDKAPGERRKVSRLAARLIAGKGVTIESAEGRRYSYGSRKTEAVEPVSSSPKKAKGARMAAAMAVETELDRLDSRSPEVLEARAMFIEDTYPVLFGEEEQGDPYREMTPSELTAVLVAYESRLAANGLLKTAQQGE